MKISMTIYPDQAFETVEETLRAKINLNDETLANYSEMISTLREVYQKRNTLQGQGISMNLKREFTVGGVPISIVFTSQKPGLLRRLFTR